MTSQLMLLQTWKSTRELHRSGWSYRWPRCWVCVCPWVDANLFRAARAVEGTQKSDSSCYCQHIWLHCQGHRVSNLKLVNFRQYSSLCISYSSSVVMVYYWALRCEMSMLTLVLGNIDPWQFSHHSFIGKIATDACYIHSVSKTVLDWKW